MSTIEEKYAKMKEAQKRANQKYIETHRDKINEKHRTYYHIKLMYNEEYKEKKRAYNRLLYQKKKSGAVEPPKL
jgi:hypothetical protein